MTTEQARDIFDAAHADAKGSGDHDGAAKVELLREYFCNPEFRRNLHDFVWEQTKDA